MKFKRKTIRCQFTPDSLVWSKEGDYLIDALNSYARYYLDGSFSEGGNMFNHNFDSVLYSNNHKYVLFYRKFGTSAVVINTDTHEQKWLTRDSHQANRYEFPIAFMQIKGKDAIVYCPKEYDALEIELLETGEVFETEKEDFFHSRLQANPQGDILISAGWAWSPFDMILSFDVQKYFIQKQKKNKFKPGPNVRSEVSSADFITDNLLLVVSGHEAEDNLDDEPLEENEMGQNEIGVYDFDTGIFIKKVSVSCKMGTAVALSEDFAIDFYGHPKLINLNTGQVEQEFTDIYSGVQTSSISAHHRKTPPIAIDKENRRIAMAGNGVIEVLSW